MTQSTILEDILLVESVIWEISVADPGFPRGGGTNPQGRGAKLLFSKKIPENCMKMKEFGPRGGCASLAPLLRSANEYGDKKL